MLDRKHAALRPPRVVHVEPEPEVLVRPPEQPREHPHSVPQQARVRGCVHVRLHHRAVHPYLATPLHPPLRRVPKHRRPDGLERLGPHLLQILRQRRTRRRGLQRTEAAERPVAHRVREVELQLPVTEAIHLLEKKHTKNLIPAHPPRPRVRTCQPAHQVLPYALGHGKMQTQDLADLRQFLGVAVLDVRLLQ